MPHQRRLTLMQSDATLLGTTAAGKTTPIDLGLVPHAGGFAPVSAAIAVQLPASTSTPVRFSSSGIGVGLPQAGAPVDAQLSADRAFYSSVSPDEDVSVNAVPQGVEVNVFLRSPAAARTVPLTFSLPAGATLRLAGPYDARPEPPGTVAIELGGRTVGLVMPASGVDAQGRPVGVTYSLRDPRTLLMQVELPTQVAWPVAIDPIVWVSDTYPQSSQTTAIGSCWNDWSPLGTGGMTPFVYTVSPQLPDSQFITTAANTFYPKGAVGECARAARPNSYIWGVQEYNTSLQLSDGSGFYYGPVLELDGLYDPSPNVNYYATGNWIDQGKDPGFVGSSSGYAVRGFARHTGDVTFFCVTGCAPGPGIHDGIAPFFSLDFWAAYTTGAAYPYIGISDATTFASDNHPPTITQDTVTPTVTTGWVKSLSETTSLAATDLGLGMSQLSVSGPGIVDANNVTAGLTATNSCTGASGSLCPVEPTPYSAAIAWHTTAATPDGVDTITDTATDIVNNKTTATHQVKIDQTPPVLGALGGSLGAAITAGAPLRQPVYDLQVTANDAASGAQSITAAIDCPNVNLAGATQSDPADGASLSDQVTLNTLACSRGMHTLTLTATDRVGNATTQTLSVDLEPQAGTGGSYRYESQQLDDRMGLSENIGTGGLTLDASDVSIAGTAGLGLAVTRTYSALAYPLLPSQSRADARDLSPGWRLSIGPDVHLNTTTTTSGLPAGWVRYYGPGGETYVFQPKTGGGFSDAPGLPAHLVANGDGTFSLSFYLSNGAYRFAAPVSGSAPAPLSAEIDRNGNTVAVSYVAGTCGSTVGCEVSTIQGTQGQALSFSYNGAGQVSQIQDASGRKWAYNYDANANLNLYTDPTGAQTAYHYDPNTDLLTNVQDPKGTTTNIVYSPDGSHRVANVTEPDGTPNGQITRFAYPNNATETDVTNANGFIARYQLDALGRVVRSSDPDGFTTNTGWTKQADGTPSTARTNEMASDPSTGASTTSAYFGANDYRPTQSIDQSGAKSSCAYPASGANMFAPSSCTDDLGNTLSYGYDPANNLKTVSGTLAGQTQTPVNLSYNSDGTLAQSIDGANNTTTYRYTNGQLTETDPPGPLGKTTASYDPAGRVQSTTDGAGRTTSYTYDKGDRVLTQASSGGGTPGTVTVTYTYDGNGNLLTTTDPAGTTIDTPDQANRLVSEQRPDGTTARYGYDEDNNLTSLNDGIYDTQAFAYDNADRLQTVTATTKTGQLLTWGYAHTTGDASQTNGPGAMMLTGATVTDPNGIVESSALTAGQLTDLKYTGTAGTLQDFNYSYTAPGGVSGLIQSRTTLDGTKTSYAYDTFNRLATATATQGGSQTASYQYVYDGAGNRTSQTINGTPTTFAYNAANELTTATTQGQAARTFGYDAPGNQTSDSTGYTNTYNQLNQTTNLASPGNPTLTPTYHGAGQANRTTLNINVKPTDTALGTTLR